MKFDYEEFDLSGVRTYPLASRKSKANAADFARPHVPGSGMRAWLESLPHLLGAADFRAVVAAMRAASVPRAAAIVDQTKAMIRPRFTAAKSITTRVSGGTTDTW